MLVAAVGVEITGEQRLARRVLVVVAQAMLAVLELRARQILAVAVAQVDMVLEVLSMVALPVDLALLFFLFQLQTIAAQ
jgi:hypothetical protein